MLQIVAGVVESDGEFLIAQRLTPAFLAGKWEFPGGKLEAGETPERASVRELREEFAIETACVSYLGSTTWQDAHGAFEMRVYLMRHTSGEVIVRVHKAVQWVSLDELPSVDLAPVDYEVIPMLRQLQSPNGKH